MGTWIIFGNRDFEFFWTLIILYAQPQNGAMGWLWQKFLRFHQKFEISIFDENHEFLMKSQKFLLQLPHCAILGLRIQNYKNPEKFKISIFKINLCPHLKKKNSKCDGKSRTDCFEVTRLSWNLIWNNWCKCSQNIFFWHLNSDEVGLLKKKVYWFQIRFKNQIVYCSDKK